MSGVIGEGVSLRGTYFEDFHLVYNISGTVVAGDVGKAVTLDTTAANTAKLAGDGDVILGVLISYENRVQEGVKVGTVAEKFILTLPYTGTIPAIGVQVVGGTTAGSVKTVVAAQATGYTNTPAICIAQNEVASTITVKQV